MRLSLPIYKLLNNYSSLLLFLISAGLFSGPIPDFEVSGRVSGSQVPEVLATTSEGSFIFLAATLVFPLFTSTGTILRFVSPIAFAFSQRSNSLKGLVKQILEGSTLLTQAHTFREPQSVSILTSHGHPFPL